MWNLYRRTVLRSYTIPYFTYGFAVVESWIYNIINYLYAVAIASYREAKALILVHAMKIKNLIYFMKTCYHAILVFLHCTLHVVI